MAERHANADAFAGRLKAEREARGWGYREVAALAKTTHGHLHNIEHGIAEPGLSVASRIADAFGLPLSEFLVIVQCGKCLDRPPAGYRCLWCSAESDR